MNGDKRQQGATGTPTTDPAARGPSAFPAETPRERIRTVRRGAQTGRGGVP